MIHDKLFKSSYLMIFISVLLIFNYIMYTQEVQGIKPCVLCIYQRVFLLSSGIIAFLLWSSRSTVFDLILQFAFLFSSGTGLYFVVLQLWPKLSKSTLCLISPQFPSWLPLHIWFPKFFFGQGSCFLQKSGILSLPKLSFLWFSSIFIINIVYMVITVIKFMQNFVYSRKKNIAKFNEKNSSC